MPENHHFGGMGMRIAQDSLTRPRVLILKVFRQVNRESLLVLLPVERFRDGPRPVIRQFILERLDITLPVRTFGHYLKRWGFTLQRPKKVACEQQPAAVREWIEEQYPAIMKRAKAEKAEILWGDETGVSNQDHSGQGYAPKGKTPEVRGLARRAPRPLPGTPTVQPWRRPVLHKISYCWVS